MSDWIRTSERLPTRHDANEKGEVWVDDGLQVRLVALGMARSADWWHPCPVRVKPGRAERMGE